jgi:hypothetical protein
MAKDILILPNRNNANPPTIEFRGASGGLIDIQVQTDGTVKWVGSAGDLITISDTLVGDTFVTTGGISAGKVKVTGITTNNLNDYVVVDSSTGQLYYRTLSAGTNGTSGSSGITGSSGTSGVTGTSGTSGVGGSSGTSGADGSSGTSGVTGTSGTSGDTGTSGTSGITGSSGTSGVGGSSGTSGIDGSSGTSGANGTSGTSGANGTSGSSGISGTDGTSGISGTDGTSGVSGTDGTSGTSGLDGTFGSSGTSGINGSSGTSGISGTDGTSGISGTDGTSGISGTDGTSGTSGLDGTFGSSGTSGINGSSGTSGISGTDGTSGISGTDGTSGISGTDGTSGISGTDGTSGTSGISGTSGTSGGSGALITDGWDWGTPVIATKIYSSNGALDSSTTLLNIAEDSLTFTNYSSQFATIGIGSRITTRGGIGGSNVTNWVVTSVNDAGIYWEFGVTYQSGTQWSPTAGDDIICEFAVIPASGSSGTSGVSGTSGISGTDGTSGTSGIDGSSGTSGIAGSSGTSGQGTSGTSGLAGSSGTSGTASIPAGLGYAYTIVVATTGGAVSGITSAVAPSGASLVGAPGWTIALSGVNLVVTHPLGNTIFLGLSKGINGANVLIRQYSGINTASFSMFSNSGYTIVTFYSNTAANAGFNGAATDPNALTVTFLSTVYS